MRRTSLGIALLSLLVPSAILAAEPKDKCDGVSGIDPADLAACNQEAFDRCRPSYRDRCVTGIHQDYREKARDRAKQVRQSAADEAQRSLCTTEPFLGECAKAQRYYTEVCSLTGSLIVGVPSQGANERWRLALPRAPEAQSFWEGYAAKYSECNNARYACSFEPLAKQECLRVVERFRTVWRDAWTTIEQGPIARAQADIAKLAKDPLDVFARRVFTETRASLKELEPFVKIPYLQADVKKFEGWTTWLDAEEQQWRIAREQALAKVKCPTPKNRDQGLTRKLDKVLVEHLASTRSPTSTMKEQVGQFGLAGTPRQTREPLARLLHEDIAAFACVRQEQPDTETVCRILELTFRRTKPDGGSFGQWEFYSVGGGQEMSCRNLKLR